MIIPYVNIDGYNYAVQQGSYTRNWIRSFTSYLAANIVRLNFIDRGPGVRTYTMQLNLTDWPNNGILGPVAGTPEQQMSQLEATYSKIATPVSFTDPFGVTSTYGVYMTDLKQTIPNWATTDETFILATVELTEATQLVN